MLILINLLSRRIIEIKQFGNSDFFDTNVAKVNAYYNAKTNCLKKEVLLDLNKDYNSLLQGILREINPNTRETVGKYFVPYNGPSC